MKPKSIPIRKTRSMARPARRRAARRRCLEALALLALELPAPAISQPAAAPADELAFDQMSVRELMRLDTELALDRAKKALRKEGQAGADRESGQRHAPVGAPELVAIYGVGKKLLAEVMIGAQAHVYMRGHPLPVGVKANPHVYMLRGISGSCVELERQGEVHSLCLRPSGRIEK